MQHFPKSIMKIRLLGEFPLLHQQLVPFRTVVPRCRGFYATRFLMSRSLCSPKPEMHFYTMHATGIATQRRYPLKWPISIKSTDSFHRFADSFIENALCSRRSLNANLVLIRLMQPPHFTDARFHCIESAIEFTFAGFWSL